VPATASPRNFVTGRFTLRAVVATDIVLVSV
jgi:hypothetical protein